MFLQILVEKDSEVKSVSITKRVEVLFKMVAIISRTKLSKTIEHINLNMKLAFSKKAVKSFMICQENKLIINKDHYIDIECKETIESHDKFCQKLYRNFPTIRTYC